MKFSSSFVLKWAASIALIAAFTQGAAAQSAAPNQVLVTAIGGAAKLSTGGGGFGGLTVGQRLRKGDVIKTGPSSHVDIEIGNSVGVIQVAANSTFAIVDALATRTAADTVTDTQLDLSEGAMVFKVNKLSKASRYEIKTPRGIAGVRGTTGYLTAGGELTVGEGTAGISYFGGGTHVLHDGQSIAPGDAAPKPASGSALKALMDAVWDATHHGTGSDTPPFVSPPEFFTSPVLPPVNLKGGGGSGGTSEDRRGK
jgi:hypothetical protein